MTFTRRLTHTANVTLMTRARDLRSNENKLVLDQLVERDINATKVRGSSPTGGDTC